MTQMEGKRALLEQLVADGVEYIFGNPGTTEQAFQDMLQEYPQLTYILCLHEGVAICMADAYARATGKPAFVQLHIAPGLGNAMGMLYNAYSSHSPLVVYVGQSASTALVQEPLLSADLVGMAAPVTKWAVQVEHAGDVAQMLRRANNIASLPPRGPVVIAVPIDVMDEMAEVEITPTSYTRWSTSPDPSALLEATELLRGAESPLVIVGDEVGDSDGVAEVEQLAVSLGAPVWIGYSTQVNITPDHPLVAGTLPATSISAPRIAEQMLSGHDVVLVLGSPVFRFIFPRPGSPVPQGIKVIQIGLDSWELGKNVPDVLGVVGNVREAATQLSELLGELPGATARTAAITAANSRARQARLAIDDKLPQGPAMPVALAMRELAGCLPEDVAIFEEAMTSASAFSRHVPLHPGRYFRARGGGIGPGIPGAIGLKLANPDRPVIGVVSDGSGMFSITALWTAAHHRVPVVWLVINNNSYRILKENLVEYLGDKAGSRRFVELDLTNPSLHYDEIARSFGVDAVRVTELADLRPALERAFALGAPALVEVMVDSEVEK